MVKKESTDYKSALSVFIMYFTHPWPLSRGEFDSFNLPTGRKASVSGSNNKENISKNC
jgi:hypothetical protein